MSIQLSDYLLTLDQNNFLDTDPRWRIFVIDHKELIKANSSYEYIDNEVFVIHRLDTQRLLKQHYNIDPNLYWVFYLINDIKSEIQMDYATKAGAYYYIPSFEYMTSLQKLFSTSINHQVSKNL